MTSTEDDAATSIGVDVGGTWLKTVVTRGADVLHRRRIPRSGSLASLLPSVVGDLTVAHATGHVGIGIAGLVDHERSRFIWGPHLADAEVDIAALLTDSLDSLIVDNDANCAAYGEWRLGAAQGHDVALTVSVGTGIGAGMVVLGEIWRGNGLAGEVGHMRIGSGAEVCACGQSGCWETLVSGRQLARLADELGYQSDGAALVDAARDGSVPAIAALQDAGRWLGVGLTNLILVLDPSVVVVAGGVSAAGPLILDAARERIASSMPGYAHRRQPAVVAAHHGPWAAAVGAALLARPDDWSMQTHQERNETE